MMKKITLLCMLLAVSFAYAQSLPLDFSDAGQAFTWDASDGAAIGGAAQITSGQLELIGNGNTWDNAFISFTGANVVDLSDNGANTITFTMQSTTASVGEVHTHRIKLSTTAGDHEENWTTTGLGLETVVIDPPNALGDLTELRIFPDSGFDGNSDIGSYLIDDIAVFADTQVPTGFTATVGTISAFGVELLLNGTDDSGNVNYDITYNGGGVTVPTVTGDSGVEKSYTIYGLTPETAYSFVVAATDGAGNSATNNSITLPATTTADTSTECAGQTADYAYTFETLANGTDVKVTIEILTTIPGLVAQFFNDGNGNQNPTLVSGQKYEYTFTGLTNATVIAFTASFAWTGNSLPISRSYTVGDDCTATASVDRNNLLNVSLSPSPAKNELKISAENTIERASIYNVLGKEVKSFSVNAKSKSLDVSNLSTGIYILKYTVNNTVGSMKFIKQ